MGGVETYVRRLVPELVALSPGTRFTLFLSRPGEEALREEPWFGELDVVRHPLLGVRGLTAVSEMALLGRLARSRGVQVLDSTAHTGPRRMRDTAHVVTIADLTWMAEPASVPRATRAVWRAIVPGIARHADRILTFSDAARREIGERLGIAGERVDVVPHGPGASISEHPVPGSQLRARLDLGDGPIVLAVGTNRANKNPERLIEAMGEVVERVPGAVLAMPGPRHPGEPELRRLADAGKAGGSVRFPGHVSEAELDGLYREAAC